MNRQANVLVAAAALLRVICVLPAEAVDPPFEIKQVGDGIEGRLD